MNTQNNFNQFFNGLMPEIKRLKNGAQIISGLTAAVGIWYIVAPRLVAFHWAIQTLVACVLVALSIIIIEGGLRKLAPFAIRQAVWWNFENRWWMIMAVPVMIVTMALMTSTTALSWFASPEIIQQVTPTADTTSTHEIANTYDIRRESIVSDFEKQKQHVKQAMKQQKQAIASKYDTKANRLEKRAKRDHNSRSWLNVLAGKERDKKRSQIAQLTAKESDQLNDINTAQITALEALTGERSTMLAGAVASNTLSIEKVQSSVNLWGRFLAWLAAGATALFFCCVFIEEVFQRGSTNEWTQATVNTIQPQQAQIGFVQAYKKTETTQTDRNTKNTQDTVQTDTKKQYKEYANKTRLYWKRYMKQPKTETGRSNKKRSQEYAVKLEALGYKVTMDPNDKSKVKIKPIDSQS